MTQDYKEKETINYFNESIMGGVSPLTKEKAKILYSQLDKYICKIYSVNETFWLTYFKFV